MKQALQYRKITETELTFGTNCPYVDFKHDAGKLIISRATLKLIGSPTGIRFQWNPVKCTLIIEPTTIEDPDGFPVIGVTYASKGSLFIGCRTLMRGIWKVIDWDKTLRYRMVAKHNKADNIAIFELNGAFAFEVHEGKRKSKS